MGNRNIGAIQTGLSRYKILLRNLNINKFRKNNLVCLLSVRDCL